MVEGNRERIVWAVKGELISQLGSLCADDLLARERLLLTEHEGCDYRVNKQTQAKKGGASCE